jgi:hypothetical protein
MSQTVPYVSASSGAAAREEIKKILHRFGCETVGFIDAFDKQEILLVFAHRGRQMQLRASGKGWAQLWLEQNPWNNRCRDTRQE